MRSTKDQLVKRRSYAGENNVFLWNLPDVEEVPSHDGETILLWSPWNTAADSVRYAKKQNTSLRAQAHQSKSRTETCELVEEKQKLLDIRERKENARGARAGVTF
ncbi:hypothetical protein TNCV_4996091 [Trichonephila clavipes]|nr:hypothetical protein TNCV_4996091 [Trichonephila clavipes]